MKSLVLGGAICLAAALAWANWPAPALPAGTLADRVVVKKGKRELTLFRGATVLKRYAVALGRVPEGPKDREGDKKTPEGVYRIIEHKYDSDYHLALRVSYPEAKDVLRAQGLGVNPGFDIMVHGLPNGLGFLGRLHGLRDWTAGCIAVTNPEIREIAAAVPDGTVIEIQK